MQFRSYLGLGQHRGAPRIWLQGECLRRVGAEPGVRFRLCPDPDTRSLVIEITDAGDRRVSSKGPDFPIIDINTVRLADVFGLATRLKAEFAPGRIILTLHPDDVAAEQRLATLQSKLDAGEPLSIGSLFHGAGPVAQRNGEVAQPEPGHLGAGGR